MLRNKQSLTIIVLIIVITIGGIVKYRTRAVISPDDAIWVQASVVTEVSLPLTVTAMGTLVARSVEMTPEVAGQIEKIFFQDGAHVKQGTVLMQLDDAVYKAKNQSAKAQLVYSENNYQRMALLGKQGAVTQQAIDQADADLKEKKAAAEETAVMLNKMKVIAPFAGIVGKSKVYLGDYVTVGQSVVTLTDTQHLHVEYNISEKYLPLLKLAQAVTIKATAYPDITFSGKVAYISPTISTDNRSVALYAEVPNESNQLAAGMFVDVTQALGSEERALMIPARSLVPILDAEQVYKIVDGKAYATTVLLGKRVKEYVQVLQGLSKGDLVITDGQLKVKNTVAVKIRES